MKREENENTSQRSVRKSGQDLRGQEDRDALGLGGVYELSSEAAAAALWGSLSIGEQPMLSGEQSMEAAGMLGNQNVLGLIDTGRRVQDALTASQVSVDIAGLANALSGPPDGAVCDMGGILGESV